MKLGDLRSGWTADNTCDVGRAIYEAVPIPERPDWAASIVLYTAGDLMCPELQRLVDISFNPARWLEAHEAFQQVRQLTLNNERRIFFKSRLQLVLDIGETAAKVIYNASGGAAPFDPHAGWRMAPGVKRPAEKIADPTFEPRSPRLRTSRA
jgi:hypothetical protein